MALEPWRIGIVVKIKQLTYNTRSFFIEVPELEKFSFKPGQFVTLDLPIHEKANKRWRSYSIANCPNDTNIFELCIEQFDEGLGSTYLFNKVTVGSQLTLRGPAGVFTLPDTVENDLFLICTGTGIAPFRSMVQNLANKTIQHKNVYLIFGCQKPSDLLYADELIELMNKLKGFTFYICYSKESVDNSNPFIRAGYVHQVYEEICDANKTASAINPNESVVKPASFYLCGWQNMVDEAKKRLLALGYDKKSIHQELYG
ncbi:MAG: FAD-dependent oxidoreductase [Chitinophagaceae bacterium]|nr:FAD-dependent oxidoreductase [Chitinophagaceae bacterium]